MAHSANHIASRANQSREQRAEDWCTLLYICFILHLSRTRLRFSEAQIQLKRNHDQTTAGRGTLHKILVIKSRQPQLVASLPHHYADTAKKGSVEYIFEDRVLDHLRCMGALVQGMLAAVVSEAQRSNS